MFYLFQQAECHLIEITGLLYFLSGDSDGAGDFTCCGLGTKLGPKNKQ